MFENPPEVSTQGYLELQVSTTVLGLLVEDLQVTAGGLHKGDTALGGAVGF